MAPLPLPRINTDLGLRPDDRATSSSVMAGRRIAQQYQEVGAAYNELGHALGSGVSAAGKAYVDYEQHREISQGAVGYAKLQQDFVNQWNEATKNADPNDPSVASHFREQVMEPALQKFRDAFRTEGGQQWADRHTSTLREHMFAKTTADMARMAGHAAAVNTEQLVNTFSTTAMDDPTTALSSMATFKSTVAQLAASNPNFTPEQRSHFQSEVTQKGMEKIAQSAVFGAIQANPAKGMEFAKNPELAPYLSGFDVKKFEAYARSQQRIEEYERRNARTAAKQEQEDRADASMRELLPRLYSDKPDVSREELNRLLAGEQITPRVYEHAIKIMEHAGGEKLPPGVADTNAIGLIGRIRNGQITSMEPIYDALAKREIDYPRFKQVQQELRDFKSDDGTELGKVRNLFLRDYSRLVNPPDINNQHWYPEREFDLYRAMRRQEQLAREKTEDPHAAYDKNSPYFIGKQPEAQPISPWQLRQDMERRSLEAGAAAPPPPKPDGVPDDFTYDARLKAWVGVRNGQRVKWKP